MLCPVCIFYIGCTGFDDLEIVEGEIPGDLNGIYVRTGPNPVLPIQDGYHWFDGDGAVFGFQGRHDGVLCFSSRAFLH